MCVADIPCFFTYNPMLGAGMHTDNLLWQKLLMRIRELLRAPIMTVQKCGYEKVMKCE